MNIPNQLRRLPLLAGMALLTACPALGIPGPTGPSGQAVRPPPPKVRVSNTQLSKAPSNEALAGYFCAQHAPALLCRVFGPVPQASDINFAFDVELELENTASIPLPVVSALVAFTAYPDSQSDQNLGAVCMSFCEDPNNCAQDATNACESNEPEIKDLESFAMATVGFLARAATGEVGLEDLRIKTIPAGQKIKAVIRLQINPNQMLKLIQELGVGIVDQVKQGKQPSVSIPYKIEGSVWVSVANFGRFAAGFGPVTGEWGMLKTQ